MLAKLILYSLLTQFNLHPPIQGHLELKYKNGSWDDSPDFAFIGDYYVHHSVLCEYNITKDCYVTADVIYAGQGKWKVIKIHQ